MAWNFANSRITNSACLLLSPLSCPMANRKPWNRNFVNSWNHGMKTSIICSSHIFTNLESTTSNFFHQNYCMVWSAQNADLFLPICPFISIEKVGYVNSRFVKTCDELVTNTYFVFCMKKSMFEKLHIETIYLK